MPPSAAGKPVAVARHVAIPIPRPSGEARVFNYNPGVTSVADSPTTGPASVSLRAELPYIAVLLAWFAGAGALGAGKNVPVIDDWTYAWSVEQLLRTGRFDVLGFSAVYPFALTLWGAAWASCLGFSFVTLRFSTLALGFVGTAAVTWSCGSFAPRSTSRCSARSRWRQIRRSSSWLHRS